MAKMKGGLVTVGSLWKPDKEAKYIASGYIEVTGVGPLLVAAGRGERQARVMIFKNDEKKGAAPDFRLVIAYGDDGEDEGGGGSSGSDW